jgi:hypothetical protein
MGIVLPGPWIMSLTGRRDRLVLVRLRGARVCWRPIDRAREAAFEITGAGNDEERFVRHELVGVVVGVASREGAKG